MERLTKQELRDCNNMDLHSRQMDWQGIYNRLADFEDFMEQMGFESLDDIKEMIHTWSIYRNSTGVYYKEAEQEKQTLKYRWQRLKEIIEKDVKHNEREFNENYIFAFEHYSTAENWILDRMKELEEEE